MGHRRTLFSKSQDQSCDKKFTFKQTWHAALSSTIQRLRTAQYAGCNLGYADVSIDQPESMI